MTDRVPLMRLDDIESQLDDTVPYYLPWLVRFARQTYLALAKAEERIDELEAREAADALKATPPTTEEEDQGSPGTSGQEESDAMRLQPQPANAERRSETFACGLMVDGPDRDGEYEFSIECEENNGHYRWLTPAEARRLVSLLSGEAQSGQGASAPVGKIEPGNP